MAAPAVIAQLVERFESHWATYHSADYHEAQLRQEFLNPLFKALGWDMDNEKGYSDAYKEVIHEAAIKVGGRTKAPDYCFRAGGGKAGFFVEAKKPAVDVAEAVSPAYQLRRYGWSAKLAVSILTDFEQLVVYDCRIRPMKTDKLTTARVLFYAYKDYIGRWDEIGGLLSPEAIRRGSLEKFLASKKVRKGTAAVDAAFLAEIETWRDVLARNVALRNPGISQRDLNFAVQRTIDRTVFLRICEDRGIEPYGRLQALVNGPKVYARLGELFQQADERYNSGLFHFTPEKDRNEPPDELTLGLTIDDKPLRDIIESLYYPESPYEFSVLPAEILGQVYEQFLGKVIRLTKTGQARVDEKLEVRKAGGVYYTPAYIVDYIVGHTVGKLLEGKSPSQAAKLRILDPACGSGSFLIGAYRRLLDWHRDAYLADDPEKHARGRNPKLYRGAAGDWRLTTAERKRILLNGIYGVDIDPQAVEVTKLSLLLKVLEGQSKETVNNQLRLYHERALPDLGRNIKCGNSLVGPDFYANHQKDLFDEETMYRINAFDWGDPKLDFGEILRDGGFDAVIGNPPYVRMEEFKEYKEYFRKRYCSHDERSDLYVYFMEREHDLLRDGGKFGMIVSNKFLRANYGRNVRKRLAEVARVDRIVDLAGLRVFEGPTVRPIVLITTKTNERTATQYSPPPAAPDFAEVKSETVTLAEVVDRLQYRVPATALAAEGWSLGRREHAALVKRLVRGATPLLRVCDGKICRGIVSGLTAAFVISGQTRRRLLRRNPRAKAIIRPFLQGRHIRRYHLEPEDQFLIYTYHGIDMKPYPGVLDHLRQYKERLQKRATNQPWYELQQPQYAYVPLLEKPKIVFPDMATTCRFTLDADGHFGANTVYFLPTDDPVLLAILNSRLAFFYFKQKCAALEGAGEAYLRFFGQYLEDFSVRLPRRSENRYGRAVELVEGMLGLHKRLAATKSEHEKTMLHRQIAATDRHIDQLVYELYGLTDEEIKIVEEATA